MTWPLTPGKLGFALNRVLIALKSGTFDIPQALQSTNGALHTTPGDVTSVDAFGAQRVSGPTTLFASSQEYTSHPLLWEHVTAGTGTAAHSVVRNSTTLSTAGAANGARALRQTKVYHRYQIGKSHRVKMSCVPVSAGTISGGTEVRWGYYDDNNGVFAGQDATGVFVALRSDVSGSVVTTKVYSTDWTGPDAANIALDFTKDQLFTPDLQWLSVGRVRCCFEVSGRLYSVHEFNAANLSVGAYMRTANLPLRYEVTNTAAGSNVSMETICASVESEGGVNDEGGYTFSAGLAGSSVSCADSATLTPLFSIRLRDTFGGITYRGHTHPKDLSFLVTSQPIYWRMILNPATLTSGGGAVNELTAGTWANVDATYSGVEQNTAATAFTGGTVIQAGRAAAGAGLSAAILSSAEAQTALILARTYANTRDVLLIAARGVGGVASVSAGMNFEEQY